MRHVYLFAFLIIFISACKDDKGATPQSSSGARKTTVKVQTADNGNTIEQNNVIERLKRDNQPGSIKHLYVISSMSGQVLIYSTVQGKVTSSSKRLSPSSVSVGFGGENGFYGGFNVDIGGSTLRTTEVLGDDGTYGSSIEYLYWFDVRGVYHQHFKGGNEMVHISDAPMQFKTIVINMEADATWKDGAAPPQPPPASPAPSSEAPAAP